MKLEELKHYAENKHLTPDDLTYRDRWITVMERRSERALKHHSAFVALLDACDNRLGKWMSAALDDPTSCQEFKDDLVAWFKAIEDVRNVK